MLTVYTVLIVLTSLLGLACDAARMHGCARHSLLKHCARHSHHLTRHPERFKKNFAIKAQVNMSTYQYAAPIVHAPRGKHSATVIVLHGLGDTGEGWSFFPSQLRGDFNHVKFMFPHAPSVRQLTRWGPLAMH
jgi:hypothetical protein